MYRNIQIILIVLWGNQFHTVKHIQNKYTDIHELILTNLLYFIYGIIFICFQLSYNN